MVIDSDSQFFVFRSPNVHSLEINYCMHVLRLLVFAVPVQLVPLYGGTRDFGYYFVDVAVGSPPQRLSAIVDTGSEGFTVTCTACQDCGTVHMDPFFNPDISSSFERLEQCPAARLRNPSCTFEKKYLEGSSLRGRFFVDIIQISDSAIIKTSQFGCIEAETKLFLEQKANGILGLAPSQNANFLTSPTPIEAFSLCLALEGGELDLHTSIAKPVDAIPLRYRDNHYVVEPVEISLHGGTNKSFWSSANSTDPVSSFIGTKALIDSGSTITYLRDALYQILIKYIEDQIMELRPQLTEERSGPSLCWVHASGLAIAPYLPVVEFYFAREDGNGTVSAKFKDYSHTESAGLGREKTCLTVASNHRLSRTDFGASWMLNKRITFSTSGGWLHLSETLCPRTSLDQRPPVIALPGQIVPRVNFFDVHVLAILGVMGIFSFFLIAIIRSSLTKYARTPMPSSTQIE